MAAIDTPFPVTRPRYTGILEWVTTVDHKKIGILYLWTTFFFFVTGGLLALAVRAQLATPDGTVLSAEAYNGAFTMHGTTMIFLFVVPVWTGFANFIIPLQIGARDMAFPKLNALSYWLLLFQVRDPQVARPGDQPALRRIEARDRSQQRRLPAAVRTDEPDPRAVRDRPGQLREDRAVAVRARDRGEIGDDHAVI